MNFLINFLVVLVVSLSIAILFKAPRKYLAATVLVGVISFFTNYFLKGIINEIPSIAISAFIMAVISQILSKITKSPSQGFLISGAIFLVPGIKLLGILNNIKADNTYNVIEGFYSVAAITCTISFAIIIAAIIVPTYREL